MQLNQVENSIDLNTQSPEASFSTVWGNAMQREDFLALAAGLRQFNANQTQVTFSAAGGLHTAQTQVCA